MKIAIITMIAFINLSAFGAGDEKLELILLNEDILSRARESCPDKKSPLRPAYDRLLRDAKKALDIKPASVMEKTSIPPSGDKHDYFSIGPYWWPNPNTPDGLPYISKDGVTNPERSTDAYDPGRAGKIYKAVETLALAYYFSGDEMYASHAAVLLKTWYVDPETRMNPNLEYAQVNPGHKKVTGTGIIDTVGMIEVPDAITLLSRSKTFSPELFMGLKDWFGKYVDWLLTSEKGKLEAGARNNHGVWYAAQTSVYALFAGRVEVCRKMAETGKVQIAGQIEPDGRMPFELKRTKSFHYSVYNLNAFFDLATAGQHAGVNLWKFTTQDGRSLRKAFEFVAQYSDSSNKWEYQEIKGYKGESLYPMILHAGTAWNDQYLFRLADKLRTEDQNKERIRLLLNR